MLDLPGFGLSTAANRPLSLMKFTDGLKELVDYLDLEQFAVMGHSMGGQLGLMFELRFPGRIAEMHLISPAGIEMFSPTELAMIKPSIKAMAMGLETSGMVDPFFHGLSFKDHKHMDQFVFQMSPILKENMQAFADGFFEGSVAMLQEPVIDKLDQIKVPCHVYFGTQDPMIPNKFMHPFLSLEKLKEDTLARNDRFTWDVIDNCGHFPQLEQLEKLKELLVSRGLKL